MARLTRVENECLAEHICFGSVSEPWTAWWPHATLLRTSKFRGLLPLGRYVVKLWTFPAVFTNRIKLLGIPPHCRMNFWAVVNPVEEILSSRQTLFKQSPIVVALVGRPPWCGCTLWGPVSELQCSVSAVSYLSHAVKNKQFLQWTPQFQTQNANAECFWHGPWNWIFILLWWSINARSETWHQILQPLNLRSIFMRISNLPIW